jgi:hypothetical protein
VAARSWNRLSEKETSIIRKKLVAKKTGTTLNYIRQDSLFSTLLVTDSSGNQAGAIECYPHVCR